MRILTRYVLREVTSHALIGAAVFTFVLFTKDLSKLLELVVRNSAPLPSVAEIFFFTLPVALTYTIPMGVLVGILIGLSRLAADSEITAMRASGIGVWRFVRMLALFVAVGWGLALLNGLWLAPLSQAGLLRLQDRLKTSQASFEVQPRVFYEGFPKTVLYLQDVTSAPHTAIWKGVFLADISDPVTPRITLAERGLLLAQDANTLHLHLENGATHEADPLQPERYQISTFESSDIPIAIPPGEAAATRDSVSVGAIPTRNLLLSATDRLPLRLRALELHRRFALPTACLVFALVGIPLGLSSKKGGKSSGFVLAILLVFGYYSVSLVGVSLAREGRLPIWAGAWLADAVFLAAGVLLLHRAERRVVEILSLGAWWARVKERFFGRRLFLGDRVSLRDAFSRARSRTRVFGGRFPMLLDDYVLRDFVTYLGLITGAFLLVMLVFTLFELISDILRNHIPISVVGNYLLNVIPYFVDETLHFCMLLAVLVTFTVLQRSNEVTAMKATGISVYRVIVPVLLTAGLFAAGLFLFEQFYLPHTNKRQDALRNLIKGKPAQTYLRPDRQWIFGQNNNIYYYQFFDQDHDQFANVSVFRFDPNTYEITRRIFAARAQWTPDLDQWVYTKGWERSFSGAAIQDFREFSVATFPQFREPPAYFKKEVRQSQEMNSAELRRYINDLQQSGFNVVRLRVQLHRKFAFPLATFVMAILAIPFSLSAGRRGAITGVATAVGIGVVYLIVAGLFESMGNISQLPPALAAWSPNVLFALVGGYLLLKVPT